MTEIITTVDTPDYIGPLITEPGRIDPNTGTRRVDLWRESVSGGAYGDQAHGYALTTTYVSDDGAGCGELAYYVTRSEPNTAEVDDHAMMQGATREEIANDCTECLVQRYGEPPGLYGVETMWMWGDAVTEDDVVRPSDSADIEYDHGSALAFDTVEAAQRECDRLGRQDWSFAINLRKRS